MKLSQRVVLAAVVVYVVMILGKSVLPAWLYVVVFLLFLIGLPVVAYLERNSQRALPLTKGKGRK